MEILSETLRFAVSACLAYYYTTIIYLVLLMIVNADKKQFSFGDSSTVQCAYFILVAFLMNIIANSDLDLVLGVLVTIAVGILHLAIYLSVKYPNTSTKSFKYMLKDLWNDWKNRNKPDTG